jgi:hypothetical protein
MKTGKVWIVGWRARNAEAVAAHIKNAPNQFEAFAFQFLIELR